MDELLILYNKTEYTERACAAKMTKAIKPPLATPLPMMKQLSKYAYACYRQVEKPAHDWLKRALENRDDMIGTVFGEFVANDGEECFAFIFATQKPQEVWFARVFLQRKPLHTNGLDTEWHSMRFVTRRRGWVHHGQLPFAVGDDIVVVSGLASQTDGSLAGNCRPQASSDWEKDWPLLQTTERKPPEGARPSANKLETIDLVTLVRAPVPIQLLMMMTFCLACGADGGAAPCVGKHCGYGW
jgi:hypothetical protein